MASFYPDLCQAALAPLIEPHEKAGLSQDELAQRFGLGEGFVAADESSSARLLDPAEYVAICRAIAWTRMSCWPRGGRAASRCTIRGGGLRAGRCRSGHRVFATCTDAATPSQRR